MWRLHLVKHSLLSSSGRSQLTSATRLSEGTDGQNDTDHHSHAADVQQRYRRQDTGEKVACNRGSTWTGHFPVSKVRKKRRDYAPDHGSDSRVPFWRCGTNVRTN